MAPLRESSEECAIQLHHYAPQDEIDKGKFCLFANKKCAIQLHHYAPQDEIDKGKFCLFANKNDDDDGDLVDPKLTRQIQEFQGIYPRLLEILKSFENDYQARKGKLAILKEIMSPIIQRAIEEYNWLIFGINI
ncbi:hypothetical protein Glove_276g9 [Diversispora epigaea]|uniref:Uncharacterized protein n=1 Tax=Diversispora epigaea TaxID=1348612 RepID=A0A397I2R2_9GLOM|nr:hypothetical protein Glove_276g9 [Diversispora epigaea]